MAGSALCALSPGMLALILARGLQGLGGGGLITLGQTIVADVVTPRERGRYAAYFSVVWASASVLGPTLGGIVTEQYGWQWIFWLNLPLGLLALLVSDRALRKLPHDPHRSAIDFLGIGLLSAATVALLLVLSLGGKWLGWGSPAILLLAAGALALAAAFAGQQRRAPDPVLPPRFTGDSVIRPVLAASFIIYGGYLAIAVLVPVYFQVALGAPVGEAGLLMIPLMLSSTVTANVAGRWSRRAGRYKRPTMLGLPLAIAAVALVAALADRLSAPEAAAILMLAGFGFGPFFPCSTVAAQNAVERRDLGAVSGAVGFARALGAAIAVAAASALVLGLAYHGLPDTAQVSSIEDLARQALPAAARAGVARAFGMTFAVVAAALAVGLVMFGRVEDRVLRDRHEAAAAPAD
jgi:MFS family permease